MRAFTYSEMFLQEQQYFWFIGKHAFIESAMKYIGKKTPQILDIGCGTGGTTKFISKWGNVTGIEKNEHAASFAQRRNIQVVHGVAEHLPFKNASFDMVTLFDVLYHKGIDEHTVLREAYRVLKPNGMLLISDCAVPWIWSKHDQIMDAKYRYTKKQLKQIVTNAQFRILQIQYIFSSIFPAIVLLRLVSKNTPITHSLPNLPKSINSILSKLLKLEAHFFPSHHPFLGSSLMLIAQK